MADRYLYYHKMIIVPWRFASAPLPPFCSFLAKRWRVASALVLRHVHTGNPFPTPPPARAVRPRPSRLGARVGPSDSSLPPPTPGGGLKCFADVWPRSAKIPIPTPSPRSLSLAAPLPLPAGGLKCFADVRPRSAKIPIPTPSPRSLSLAAPLPLPAGGFKLLQAIPFNTFIVCPPRYTANFLPFFSLPSAPGLATASAWGGRTLEKRLSGYAHNGKLP